MYPLPCFVLCLALRTPWSAVSVAFPMLRKYKTPYNSINHLSKNSAKLHHSHHPHNPTFVVIPIPTFRYFPLSVFPAPPLVHSFPSLSIVSRSSRVPRSSIVSRLSIFPIYSSSAKCPRRGLVKPAPPRQTYPFVCKHAKNVVSLHSQSTKV